MSAVASTGLRLPRIDAPLAIHDALRTRMGQPLPTPLTRVFQGYRWAGHSSRNAVLYDAHCVDSKFPQVLRHLYYARDEAIYRLLSIGDPGAVSPCCPAMGQRPCGRLSETCWAPLLRRPIVGGARLAARPLRVLCSLCNACQGASQEQRNPLAS